VRITKQYLNDLTYSFIGCCISVHKELEPELLDNIYHQCLIEELKYEGISYASEIIVPINYRNIKIKTALRANLLIENCLVVELKSTNEMKNIFEAKLLTYMHLLKAPKGILINFNCLNIFKEGQKNLVNDFLNELSDN
jgi:GxxExxY protein